MKKILTLFAMLLVASSMAVVQATDTRIYCKMEYNWWTQSGARIGIILDSGSASAMTLVPGSSNTWYADVNLAGHTTIKFLRISNVNLNDWGAETTAQNIASNNVGTTNDFFTITNSSDTWRGDGNYCGGTWGTYVPEASFTFQAGTTIYYDFTAYSTTGIDTYVGGNGAYYGSTSNVIAITLSSDWTVTASTKLWRCGAGGSWNDYYCTTLPTEGQDMIVSTDGINYTWGTYGGGALPPAAIKLHSNITNPSWADTEEFTLAANEETASLTLTGVTKGDYSFGVKIAESWTSNGSAFTRDNNSHAIAAGSDNCTFNADRNGDYTFTWTYATNTLEITYPAIPAQSVTFNSLASQVLKGSVINLANCVTSSGIDDPTYRFYIKEKNGEYGDAINANYNFNANGEYVVKVEALEYGEPVADDESNVVVYQSYTFTNGSTIYVDFTAVSGDVKGVNYPKVDQVGMDWDANGAGTVKTITFTSDVTWTTMVESFIKTEKNSWANQPFIVPGIGQNCVVVAEDGASYTWGTYVPAPPTVEMKGGWDEWADAVAFAGDATSASVTKHLNKGDYEFKMIIGGEWRSNGYTYHRDYTGKGDITTNEEANMVIEADVEGDYTFTWFYANDSLSIAFQACNYYMKNNWYGCGAWKWKGLIPGANGTYRIENVVYGGNGVNYNTVNSDEGARWKKDSVLFYMDGNKQKKLMAYDTVNFVLDPANDTIWAEMVKKDVTVYTVASNSLALCDLGWQPTHPHKYTDMKKQADGTYKWTKDDDEVVLLAGSVYFKVIKDRAYENGSWPYDDSLECVIPQSGIYTIEVTFNPCTHNMTATPTLKKALNINNLIIKGSWNEKPLVLNGENDKALVTLPLEVGEYDFRLVDVESNRYGNAQAFTRANNSHRGIVAESGADMTINVDKAGEYLFTYIFESEQLVVSYPAIVPDVKIAPIGGKFTINANGDTAVFSRGNLQYNFGEQAWYAAEKQYEVLSDLNLRFGDDSYQGSIDMFGWSCDDSNYGLLKSSVDAEFTGNFVDWGANFADDEKEWSSLSRAEWDYLLLSRTKNSQYLWSMIALGPDSLRGLALFPDNWEAPAGLTINYGFYNFDDEETLKANSFSYAQWEQMEAAGAVFLPNAGVRAGYIGNTGAATNPLTGWYCWMDNVSDYGFYWLSSKPSSPIEADMLAAPWINNQNKYVRPMTTTRQRRYGHAVRLVTRIPKKEYVTVREDLTESWYYTMCLEKAVTDVRGGSIWRVLSKAANGNDVILEEVELPLDAGRPYFFYATAENLEVIYTGDAVLAPVTEGNNGLIGSFTQELIEQSPNNYILWNNELYFVNSENVYVGAHRAYLDMNGVPDYSEPQQGNGAPRRRVTMTVNSEQNATGVDEVQVDNVQCTKVLINNRLYILRGEKIYDATGRLVK